MSGGSVPKQYDCAYVPNGSAYIDECGSCVKGTTGLSPCECEGEICPYCGGYYIAEGLRSSTEEDNKYCPLFCICVVPDENDPCVKKKRLSEKFSNNDISHYSDLIPKLNEPHEWGTVLMAKYNKDSYIFNGKPDSFYSEPINTQNSEDSYTWKYVEDHIEKIVSYGMIHTHPAGKNNVDCLSVQDIYNFEVFVDLYFDAKSKNWDSKTDFLEKNTTIIAVGQKATYAATVNNWDELARLLSEQTKEQRFDNIVEKVTNPKLNYTYEAALMEEFGNAINLYISPKGDSLQFEAQDNLGNTVVNQPCFDR